MGTIPDSAWFEILYFVRDNYPISFIGIILTTFGYTMGAVGYRSHIKSLKTVVISNYHVILERLH